MDTWREKAPYGYNKIGSGDSRKLEINDEEAFIIRKIFELFLYNTPIVEIKKQVMKLGFNHSGSSAIQKILDNPIYCGLQYVKAWKDQPGGLFPLKNHPTIIDQNTWNRAQLKFHPPTPKQKIHLSEDFPLRGVIRCHCKKFLTGSFSRGRHGGYYGYYNCMAKGHNTVSLKKVHDQLSEVLKYMSLPEKTVQKIICESEAMLDSKLSENNKTLMLKKTGLMELEQQLESVEGKFIKNEINVDTYNRWYSDLNKKILI